MAAAIGDYFGDDNDLGDCPAHAEAAKTFLGALVDYGVWLPSRMLEHFFLSDFVGDHR